MKFPYPLLFLFFLLAGCQPDPGDREPASQPVYPGVLNLALQKLDPEGKWPDMRKLEFTMTTTGINENHLVDLPSRKVLIRADGYRIGFDGEQAWVSPSKEAFAGGSPRFYHSINFYFFAMPHVFTDPGIRYRVFSDRQLEGKSYKVLYIGFGQGTGDTPLDEYIAFFDPETGLLSYVLYTVTYFRDQASDQFYACRFDSWQEISGILVPEQITFLDYFDGEIGRVQDVRTFSDVSLSRRAPWQYRFNKPGSAEIDSLIERWRE